MLDEIVEMRELPCFGARLAAAGASPETPLPADWLGSWNDREGVWTNLRNIEHWIARARNSP
jgi:hypothetical protein